MRRLFLSPVVSLDPRLLQYSRQQCHSDLAAVRVWYGQALLTSRHVKVPSSGNRTLETKLS